MNAAFDTVDRSKLVEIIEEFADPDETRMVKALLSETMLELKLPGYEGDPIVFQSKTGSPQGGSISGPFFNVSFEHALREAREMITSIPTVDQHS